MVTFPRYAELPLAEPGARHAGGVFGSVDDLGRLNLVGPHEVLEGISQVREGKSYNLCLPLNLPNPPWGGPLRKPYRHNVYDIDEHTKDDYLDSFFLQRSTQWDGLRHVSAEPYGFYGGLHAADLEHENCRLSIHHWAEHGIVGRGVLLDVAGYLHDLGRPLNPRVGTPITVADLVGTQEAQNTALFPGDILMIRTGYIASYLNASEAEREDWAAHLAGPGLATDESMAEYLWDSGVCAVVTDNPAVEVVPDTHKVGALHRRLIPLLGFILGEFFDFERLAIDCHLDGRYECAFFAAPLNLPGGIGSPGNAIAIR